MRDDPTKLRLAEALREAGLERMAVKAEAGDYDESESTAVEPLLDLRGDLAAEMINGHTGAKELRQRVMAGEFDSTDDEWWVEDMFRQFGGHD
jgi:hypothetical protein